MCIYPSGQRVNHWTRPNRQRGAAASKLPNTPTRVITEEPGALGENTVLTTDRRLCVPLSRLPLQRAKALAGADTERGPGPSMHQLAEGNAPSVSAEIQRAVMTGTASLPPPLVLRLMRHPGCRSCANGCGPHQCEGVVGEAGRLLCRQASDFITP